MKQFLNSPYIEYLWLIHASIAKTSTFFHTSYSILSVPKFQLKPCLKISLLRKSIKNTLTRQGIYLTKCIWMHIRSSMRPSFLSQVTMKMDWKVKILVRDLPQIFKAYDYLNISFYIWIIGNKFWVQIKWSYKSFQNFGNDKSPFWKSLF